MGTGKLDLDLSVKPYGNDFEANNNFYAMLFRPGVAVQARELTQMGTITQDQISKFGSNIFKEGSVVSGCSFTFDPQYSYVKLSDTYVNSAALTITDLVGSTVTNQNGLQGVVVDVAPGYQSSDPNLNTIYLKYINAVTTNTTLQRTFISNEVLKFTTAANVAIGNVVVASVNNSHGKAYAMTVTEGVIFKKGYFIGVANQTIVVSKYNNTPNNASVGFSVIEEIVTPESDPRLLDNAAGSPNFAAPGAHRLKLTPQLIVKTTSDIANTDTFFSLVDFVEGRPVTINTDPQYAALGAEMARRMFETNGNFVVNPFVLSAEPILEGQTKSPESFKLNVSSGLGYVNGYRVNFVDKNFIPYKKAKTTANVTSEVIGASFGSYVQTNEVSGRFDSNDLVSVELHSVAKTSLTSRAGIGISYSSSTRIGTAYVRAVKYISGTPSTPSAQYNIYLFDINMNPGTAFSDVRSVIVYDGANVVGVADIITEFVISANGNAAVLQEATDASMLFPLGQSALTSNGFNHVQFEYKRESNTQFATTGNGSITIPSGIGATETLPYLGLLDDTEKQDFIIVASGNQFSTKAGTATVSAANTTVTGTGTSFVTDYAPGDWVYVQGNVRRVVNVTNNTFMSVDANFPSSVANTHAKAFLNGQMIPFVNRSNRSINITTTTTAVFNIGETLDGTLPFVVYYNVSRANALPIRKNLTPNVYVTIFCSNNAGGTTGPWSLGLPDVYSIDSVWISPNTAMYANDSIKGYNFRQSFRFSGGQTETAYKLSSLSLSNTALTLNSNQAIVVQLTAWKYDTTQGVGYFSGNSYPIDDVNTANTLAITTETIPRFKLRTGNIIDLRDVLDFRSYATNTAAYANTVAASTINPSNTVVYASINAESYALVPDSKVELDFSYYLPRSDRVMLDKNGKLRVVAGIPDPNPVTPPESPGMMTLGTIYVAPYPSLTAPEAKISKRNDYAIQITMKQNRRYTMKDIGSLDNRITNLEYYTSLNLLEKAASDLLITSGVTGQNRFKNGMLVDPFQGFDISNVDDPQFMVSIDTNRKEMRPAFIQSRSDLNFNANLSSNVVLAGELVMLNYTEQKYISQPYASKYRNCIDGNIYQWVGTITLDYAGGQEPDLSVAPDVVNTIDLTANWQKLSSAWGTQWGNWQTSNTSTTSTKSNPVIISTTKNPDGSQVQTYSQQTTTTTLAQQFRSGTQADASQSVDSNYNLGTFVTGISILPYIKSTSVPFSVVGMKPNTRVWAYFGNEPVSMWVRPLLGVYHANTNTIGANNTPAPTSVFPVPDGGNYYGLLGQPLVTTDAGTADGVFIIPPNKFKSQEITFQLCDVSDLTQGANSISTIATSVFYGNKLSYSVGSSILTTRNAVLSFNDLTEYTNTVSSNTSTATYNTFIPAPYNPPPPYTPYVDYYYYDGYYWVPPPPSPPPPPPDHGITPPPPDGIIFNDDIIIDYPPPPPDGIISPPPPDGITPPPPDGIITIDYPPPPPDGYVVDGNGGGGGDGGGTGGGCGCSGAGGPDGAAPDGAAPDGAAPDGTDAGASDDGGDDGG